MLKKLLVAAVILLLGSQTAYAFLIGNPVMTVQSAVAEGSHIIKATPGLLNQFTVTTGTPAGYVMFFDATTAPADGTVTPKLCYSVAATSTFSINFGEISVPFVTGIVAVYSSTGCFSKTVSNTAYFSVQAQ